MSAAAKRHNAAPLSAPSAVTKTPALGAMVSHSAFIQGYTPAAQAVPTNTGTTAAGKVRGRAPATHVLRSGTAGTLRCGGALADRSRRPARPGLRRRPPTGVGRG